nr:MAG TPA: hypothetical protein [Caudoviricetes sp.]
MYSRLAYFNKFYFLFFSNIQNLSDTHHYFIQAYFVYFLSLKNEYPY